MYNFNGETIATDATDLWKGSIAAYVRYDAAGVLASGVSTAVWTGSTLAGVSSGANCANWTSAAPGDNGGRGFLDQNSDWWVHFGVYSCDTPIHVYCVSQ